MKNSGYLRSTKKSRRPLTCLADAADLRCREPLELLKLINWGDGLSRKVWEFDYIVDCLEQLGCLSENKVGIGLGVGYEQLPFYFARKCKRVVATDLYDESSLWHSDIPSSPKDFLKTAPFEFPKEHLEVANADMRHLPGADGSYDFAWSTSSIEHVPLLKDVYLVFAELARAIKVGGYACMTTEFCVTEPPYLLPGLNAWDSHIVHEMLTKLRAFEVVGPIDLSYNWVISANAISQRRYCNLQPPIPDINLYSRSENSMGLFVGISAVVPIGLTVRRTSLPIAGWEELPIPPMYREFTEGMEAFRAGNYRRSGEQFTKILDTHRTSINLQMEIFCRAYAIVAHHNTPDINSEQNSREVREFVDCLPSGILHDGDMLLMVAPFVAHYIGKAEALNLLRLAARSPSTLPEQSLNLSLDCVVFAEKNIGSTEDVNFLQRNICDFTARGFPIETVEKTLINQLKQRAPDLKDPAEIIKRLMP